MQYEFQFTCSGYINYLNEIELKTIFDSGEHTCIFVANVDCEPSVLCDSSIEPNNSFQTATPIQINQPVTWQSSYVGDVDYFSFIATVPNISGFPGLYNSSFEPVPSSSITYYRNTYDLGEICYFSTTVNIGEKYYIKLSNYTWQCFNHIIIRESTMIPMKVRKSSGYCNNATGNYQARFTATHYSEATYYWTIQDLYGTHETETNSNILSWNAPQGTEYINVSVYALGSCTDQTLVSETFEIPYCEGNPYLRGNNSDKKVKASKVFTYPNPASDNITFDLSTIKENIESLEIYDQLGKLLYQENMQNSDSRKVISLKDFNAGLCYYLVKHDGGIVSGKFFVSK